MLCAYVEPLAHIIAMTISSLWGHILIHCSRSEEVAEGFLKLRQKKSGSIRIDN